MIKYRLRTAIDGQIILSSARKSIAFCTPDNDGLTFDKILGLFGHGGEIIIIVKQFEYSDFDRLTEEVKVEQKKVAEKIWSQKEAKTN